MCVAYADAPRRRLRVARPVAEAARRRLHRQDAVDARQHHVLDRARPGERRIDAADEVRDVEQRARRRRRLLDAAVRVVQQVLRWSNDSPYGLVVTQNVVRSVVGTQPSEVAATTSVSPACSSRRCTCRSRGPAGSTGTSCFSSERRSPARGARHQRDAAEAAVGLGVEDERAGGVRRHRRRSARRRPPTRSGGQASLPGHCARARHRELLRRQRSPSPCAARRRGW